MDTPGKKDHSNDTEYSARDLSLLIGSAVVGLSLSITGLGFAPGSALDLATRVGLPILVASGIAYTLLRGRK